MLLGVVLPERAEKSIFPAVNDITVVIQDGGLTLL